MHSYEVCLTAASAAAKLEYLQTTPHLTNMPVSSSPCPGQHMMPTHRPPDVSCVQVALQARLDHVVVMLLHHILLTIQDSWLAEPVRTAQISWLQL